MKQRPMIIERGEVGKVAAAVYRTRQLSWTNIIIHVMMIMISKKRNGEIGSDSINDIATQIKTILL